MKTIEQITSHADAAKTASPAQTRNFHSSDRVQPSRNYSMRTWSLSYEAVLSSEKSPRPR
jgi:hypothetical protein